MFFLFQLKIPSIWPHKAGLAKEPDPDAFTTLYLTFLSPFLCEAKVQTVFTTKFFNIEFLSTSADLKFDFKNHKLTVIYPNNDKKDSTLCDNKSSDIKQRNSIRDSSKNNA